MNHSESAASEAPVFPARQEFAGGILLTEGKMAFWDINRKISLYQAVEAAVAQGIRRNDLLEHLGIDRLVYYHRVDEVVEQHQQQASIADTATAEENGRSYPKRRTKPDIQALPPADQLSLLELLREDLRLGEPVRSVCQKNNVTKAVFRYLESNETSLRQGIADEKRVAEQQSQAAAEQEKQRRKHIADEQQRVAVDAVELLTAGSVMTTPEAAELFGRSDQSIRIWRKKHHLEPLVSDPGSNGESGRHQRRSPDEMVRIVYAVQAVNEKLRRKIGTLIGAAKVSYPAFAKWQDRLQYIEAYITKIADSNVDPELYSEFICAKIAEATGMRVNRVCDWLESIQQIHPDEEVRNLIETVVESETVEQEESTTTPKPSNNGDTNAANTPLPGLAEVSKEELAQRAQTGDSAAMGELWRRLQGNLHGYAMKILRNEHDVEELLQEAYLIAFDKINQLREPAAVNAWIYRVVRSRATNYSRKRKKEALVEDFFDNDSGTATPVEQLIAKEVKEDERERTATIHTVLDELDDVHRETMVLRYVHGLSLLEISKKQERPLGTIKRRLHKGRKLVHSDLVARGVTNFELAEEEMLVLDGE